MIIWICSELTYLCKIFYIKFRGEKAKVDMDDDDFFDMLANRKDF